MSDKPILVTTALDDAGREAILQAATWATRRGVKLIVAHALAAPGGIGPLLPHLATPMPTLDLRNKAEEALANHVAQALGADAEVECVVVEGGSPHGALLELIGEVKPQLVVVGRSGKATFERLLLGSTAERLLRHAGCSVLVARPSPRVGIVLAATDLSDAALVAVDEAAVEAAARGVGFGIVHALDVAQPFTAMFEPTATLDAATVNNLTTAAEEVCKATLDRRGHQGEVHVVLGPPARAIADEAGAASAALVVVAPQGHGAIEQLLLGSVAEAVVRKASCSVLVARPTTAG